MSVSYIMNKAHSSGGEAILVVDDEPAMRALVGEILRIHGYTVLVSSSVAEALDVLQREPVVLVVSDVVMAGGDGFQLAETIKKQHPAVKILLVSGYNDYIGPNLSIEMLNKPFKSADLLLRVRALIAEV
ncbi:MAG: response regulator [Gammaproteobacteria bacterium]|nr:response regulator [Gammaproteobacteria bacterium]